jgi:hypothetical protein
MSGGANPNLTVTVLKTTSLPPVRVEPSETLLEELEQLLGERFTDLVRGTDYTVSGNTVTIRASFLSTLETGNRSITFVMSGGTNPNLTVTVINTAALPNVRVEPSEALALELEQLLGDRFTGLEIIVNIKGPEIEGGFVVADISFTAGDEELDELLGSFESYFTIYAYLYGFVYEGKNYHRIAAIKGDEIIGGHLYTLRDGTAFSVTASTAGVFEISYLENLRRLVLSPDAYTITDLASGAPAQTMDVQPIIYAGRTLIPIRFIGEALGADVDWTPATDTAPLTAHITMDGQTLNIPIGEITPQLAELGMDVPAMLVGGRTMLPLRFVSEFFGAVVEWDGDTRTIMIIN